MLKIGVSGLLATQRALATTANNIANSATEGYSRQRVNFSSRPPNFLGGSFLGTGVQISGIQRLFDQFLNTEIRSGVSSEGRLATFSGLAGRVGNIIGGPSSGVSTGLQNFFNSLESLANDPASTAVRQSVLSEAQSLARRFNTLDAQMQSMSREVDGRVRGTVQEVNSLTGSIALLNGQIAAALATAGDSGSPNDLLDQRDQLIAQLSSKIDVSTIDQGDGTVSVFVGSGQSLVLGGRATALTVGDGAFGPQSQEVRIAGTPISGQVSGGELGGLLQFRREILEPTRNELGLMALALSNEFNRISREGIDLNGNPGTDLFRVAGPKVLDGSDNSAGVSLEVSVSDPSQLSGADYRLTFDGGNFSLFNVSTGATVSLDAQQQADLQNGDPVTIEGLSFQVTGTPEAGDRFLVRPTVNAASSMQTLFSDPALLAAAAPVREAVGPGNTGTGTIVLGGISNPSDPNLADRVTIRFVDANNFELLDDDGNVLGGPLPFASGEPISFNGWVMRIDGAPAAGDEFSVEGNAGGVGDNRNALRMAALFEQPLLGDGSTSLFARSDALVSRVGSTAAAASTALSAQRSVLESSRAAQQSVSGVNLEEEAANLVRFQQAFEANAQVIRVADTIFQSLIAAVR